MPTYTVSVSGPGALAPGFEQMLDVVDTPALVGSEDTETATLYFDVRARNRDEAIERAWLRAQSFVSGEVTSSVVPASEVEGRRVSWWRRLLGW